jgi:DNA-binding IclR family transcriptional regulator
MKRTYRVGGEFPVLDHAPGSTFQAELDPEHESRLLERGSLTRVDNDAPKPTAALAKSKKEPTKPSASEERV